MILLTHQLAPVPVQTLDVPPVVELLSVPLLHNVPCLLALHEEVGSSERWIIRFQHPGKSFEPVGQYVGHFALGALVVHVFAEKQTLSLAG